MRHYPCYCIQVFQQQGKSGKSRFYVYERAEATLNITESPLALSHGIPFKEIYAYMIDLMLYGIMDRKKKHKLSPGFRREK